MTTCAASLRVHRTAIAGRTSSPQSRSVHRVELWRPSETSQRTRFGHGGRPPVHRTSLQVSRQPGPLLPARNNPMRLRAAGRLHLTSRKCAACCRRSRSRLVRPIRQATCDQAPMSPGQAAKLFVRSSSASSLDNSDSSSPTSAVCKLCPCICGNNVQKRS